LDELLKGAGPSDREELWGSIATLPWAELDRLGWRIVGEAAGDLRHAGQAIPLTDVQIAAATIRAGASLWTRDQDFHRIRSALPGLQLYNPGS
jgi:predicted nucleic acid-binding protein